MIPAYAHLDKIAQAAKKRAEDIGNNDLFEQVSLSEYTLQQDLHRYEDFLTLQTRLNSDFSLLLKIHKKGSVFCMVGRQLVECPVKSMSFTEIVVRAPMFCGADANLGHFDLKLPLKSYHDTWALTKGELDNASKN